MSEPSREDLVAMIGELHGEVVRLGRVKDELDWTEDALKRRTRLLSERVKELECVYDVVRLARDPGPLDARLQAIVERLPRAWQHPLAASVRLELGERVYETRARGEARVTLEAPVVDASGRKTGALRVAYSSNDSFLPEESALLQVLAQLVGLAL